MEIKERGLKKEVPILQNDGKKNMRSDKEI